MTTPPQPDPAAEKPVGQFLRPLRDLAAYALVGAPAVFLFAAFLDLFGSDFIGRTRVSFGGFVNLETILFPIAAVVLALGIRPVHPKARLITLIAIVEYAVAALFGLVFGLLFGVSGIAALDAGSAFTQLLARTAWLTLLGLAAYAVVQIWLGVFAGAKPKPQPGVYGQPYGPPAYGQAPYGPAPYGGGYPPGAPTPPAAFQPGIVAQGPPMTPGAVPPGAVPPGQPFSAPPAPYGQYPAAPPSGWGRPHPAQPGPAAPTYAGQAPPPPPPFAEPTQPVSTAQPVSSAPAAPAGPAVSSAPPAVSSAPPAPADRTAVLPPERPGFGPAGQDPPRQ